MKNLFKGWRQLRRNRRAGVSLIVAMCAAALLLGLSMSLVYSASMPMARADQKLRRERCYQLASSFAQVLDQELKAYSTEEQAGDMSFYRYANRILDGVYGEYDPDRPELTTFYYSAFGDPGDDYGKITVALRKQTPEGEEDVVSSGSFSREKSESETKKIEERTFIQYLFCVDVTAQLGDIRYTYTTEYYRRASFQPRYTFNGSEIYYNTADKNWYSTSNYQSSEVKIDPDAQISYNYDESKTVSKIFEPTYITAAEGGGS